MELWIDVSRDAFSTLHFGILLDTHSDSPASASQAFENQKEKQMEKKEK